MWMKLSALILNILLGIAGFYVLMFVLLTGGALNGSQPPSPTPLGYLVILVYLLVCFGTNYPFAKRSSKIWRYCLTSVLVWLCSFFITILL
ncbi:UNVERIFIED_CONTAM: hypothetical protein ABID98_003659 [Brevibacillus sp. OAP136]